MTTTGGGRYWTAFNTGNARSNPVLCLVHKYPINYYYYYYLTTIIPSTAQNTEEKNIFKKSVS